ncbi:MAG: hypothetical protein JO252_00840 [Planctomycetaceae bacterium]|nr:hypothetical protein [Planctomycetaceae bacterium]
MRTARSLLRWGVLASGLLWGIWTSPAQAQGIAAPAPRDISPAPVYVYPAYAYPARVYISPAPRYVSPPLRDTSPAADASPAPASGADFYTTIRKRAKTPREIESSPAAWFVGL